MAMDSICKKIEGCTNCALAAYRTNTVPGYGSPKARLVFVGEGPGEQEDFQGLPFVGRSGDLLTKAIEATGLTRRKVYITNTVKCRPPDNRNPQPHEVEACRPFLDEQLQLIRPQVLVAVGRVAADNLLNKPVKITKDCGKIFFDLEEAYGCLVIPVLHPAYVLRNRKPEVEDLFFETIKFAKAVAYGE